MNIWEQALKLSEADPPRRIMMPSARPPKPKTDVIPKPTPPLATPSSNPSGIHPRLQRIRDEIKQSANWVADQLQNGKTDAFRDVIPKLRTLHQLPSEQIAPALRKISDVMANIRRSTRDGNKELSKIVDNAMLGIYGMMKGAAQLGSSTGSDSGLYQNKIKGYTDKDGVFHTTSTEIIPTEGRSIWETVARQLGII